MLPDASSPHLPAAARRYLLARARQAIDAAVAGRSLAAPLDPPPEVWAAGGCFVTVHGGDGDLRGCIGVLESRAPLLDNVAEMAVAAATRDPRFPTLTVQELPRCVLEISALGAPRRVALRDIVVGRHGVCVERGYTRGLLLPQVASERGWDAKTFVEHTCVKAGLPRDAWVRDPEVKLFAFDAEVFGEPAPVSAPAAPVL